MMELNWIEDFLSLAASGNFSSAAKARASTQPAFSRRVRQLEDWLGAELFDRTARPVTLTVAGRDFLTRAQQIHTEIMDARRAALAGRSHFAERQRITTTNTLAMTVMPGLLAEKKIHHPSVIVASVWGCIDALQKNRADHALIPSFHEDSTLAAFQPARIARDRLLLAATPQLAATITLKQKKLGGPLIAYLPGTAFAAEITAAMDKAGIAPGEPPVAEAASAESVAALARAGVGAAWLPETLMDKDLQPLKLGGLAPIPYDIIWLSRGP